MIVPTRDTTTQTAKALSQAGAELVEVQFSTAKDGEQDQDLKTVFGGVDIVINVLGSKSGDGDEDVHSKVVKAAAECGVRVYFLSEFGV